MINIGYTIADFTFYLNQLKNMLIYNKYKTHTEFYLLKEILFISSNKKIIVTLHKY